MKALRAEAADAKFIQVLEEKGEIVIRAQSVSRLRALINSVLYSTYSVLSTLKEVEEVGRKPSA
mgnify:FL=1